MLDVFIGVSAFAILFFVIPAVSALQKSFPAARSITVSAQGKTTASPDEADISFSVVTQGQSPKMLSDNNNTKMNSVLQFVSSQGIASSDVATTNYDLEPTYQWNKDTSTNIINGYTLTQTVQVKIRDLTKVSSVLGGLAPLGVNQVGGVNFTFQDQNKFVDIARMDALSKAKQQASDMAAEAGASLGSVMNISESSNVPFPYPMAYGGLAKAMDSTATVAPTLQPGTQDVTDTVTVTYSLE